MGDETFNVADQNIEYHIVTLFERLDAMRKENPVKSVNVPARTEIRSLEFWRAVAAECMASFIYVFIVCGAAGGAGVGASTSSVLTSTALASGLAIATVTLCFSHISGAHVNPAVSGALAARRLLSPLRATLFIAAQCGGGIAAAALLYGVSVPGYGGGVSAALWPAPGAWERCGAELVLTAAVVLAHCAAAERRHTGAAPLALGAAYAGCGFVSMPYLNPARSLGPSFVLSRWENHWVYWLGPMAGGVLAGLIYEFMLAPRGARGSRDDSSSAHSDEDAYDELDKAQPAAAHGTYRAAGYCGGGLYAPAPEPLYSGSKSLYCRSPPLTRANLHRSQSVYSKANGAAPRAGPLVPAQSLYPLPHSAMAHAQNAANQMQARPAAVGAQTVIPAEARRPESVYGAVGARRGQSAPSDDSSYGSYCARAGFGPRAAPRQPAQY